MAVKKKSKSTGTPKNRTVQAVKSEAPVLKPQPKQVDGYEPEGGRMVETFNQQLFESELITSGRTIIESFTKAVWRDEAQLLKACRYIGYLQRIHQPDKVKLALMKINGTMAIEGRSRNDAVQAHVGIYFPPNASKDERKRLAEMQNRQPKEREMLDSD